MIPPSTGRLQPPLRGAEIVGVMPPVTSPRRAVAAAAGDDGDGKEGRREGEVRRGKDYDLEELPAPAEMEEEEEEDIDAKKKATVGVQFDGKEEVKEEEEGEEEVVVASVARRLVDAELDELDAEDRRNAAATPVSPPGADAGSAHQEEETAAAVKIQALHRGKVARARAAALRAEQEAAEAVAAETTAAGFLGTAAEDPDAWGNGNFDNDGDDHNYHENNAAAMKIQAVHRGRAARARVNAIRAERAALVAEATAADADAQAADAELLLQRQRQQQHRFIGTEEQHTAALKIQSFRRGRAARLEVARLKAEAADMAAEAAKEAEKAADADDVAVSEDILANHSGGDDEERSAALKIQAHHRGRVARAEVAKLKAEAAALAAEAKAARAEAAGNEDELRAALKIQAYHRGRVARAEVAKLKAEAAALLAAQTSSGSVDVEMREEGSQRPETEKEKEMEGNEEEERTVRLEAALADAEERARLAEARVAELTAQIAGRGQEVAS